MKCRSCGCRFDHAEVRRELVGEYWGDKAYENVCVCPECRSEEIEDIDVDEFEVDRIRDVSCTVGDLIEFLQSLDKDAIIYGINDDSFEEV